jgi:hypothetical protein
LIDLCAEISPKTVTDYEGDSENIQVFQPRIALEFSGVVCRRVVLLGRLGRVVADLALIY